MSIVNGIDANATNLNNAFVSKTQDTSKTGKLELANPGSGETVPDVQAAIVTKVDKVDGKGLSTEDYTTPEKTKLAGVASGATANSSDATLLARTNHTGTQAASTISDFQTTVSANTDVAANKAKIANVVAPTGARAFQIDSTTGGFLGPRMTTAQRDLLTSVPTGLEIFNTSTSKKQIYDGTTWTDVGSGSGGGGSGQGFTNNFTNPSFETGTTGWTAYANTASGLPTSATGGSPLSVGISTTATDPIAGTKSGVFTKGSGLSAFGEGISTDFTIPLDEAYIGSVQFVSFSQMPVSGTMTYGDIVVGVIDLSLTTPNNVIYSQALSPDQIKNYFTFPLKTATRNYRFFMHVAVATTLTIIRKIDNFNTGSVIPTAMTLFETQPDSILRINNFGFAQGTTATKILTLTSGSTVESAGDAIQYLDDAANGARFIALKDGTYTFVVTYYISGGAYGLGVSKNSTALTTSFGTLAAAEKLFSVSGASSGVATGTWTGPLKKNDIIRIHNNDVTGFSATTFSTFTASYTGSIKSVIASVNQKTGLPFTELRFSGYSAKGTTDTTSVKWTGISNISGDAFEIIDTAANGTYVKMRKSGYLWTEVSGGWENTNVYITKNQSTALTAAPTVESEIFGFSGHSTTDRMAAASYGRVKAGDIIRTNISGTAVALTSNHWHLLFLEDSINLSVNTTQPFWSQSDSSLRVHTAAGAGAAGFGTTNLRVRRFSSLQYQNGSSVTYIPSTTAGDSFRIEEDDIYTITYSEIPSSAAAFAVLKNPTDFTLDPTSQPNGVVLAMLATPATYPGTVPWTGPLVKGDLLYCLVQGAVGSSNVAHVSFTITRKGKPNLTSADVTPFVNYKTQDFQEMRIENHLGFGSTYTQAMRFTGATKNTNNGLVQYVQDTVFGDSIVALKDVNVTVTFASAANNGAAGNIAIAYNATVAALTSLTATNQLAAQAGPSGYRINTAASVRLTKGDTLRFYADTAPTATNSAKVNLIATADTDAIVATSKQVSSDSMTLAFKATAIAPDTDPVGTFNTYTYAANTNTATIAASAPTQTVSDMNLNGIRVYARAYNVLSTAATPARVDIFVGKGLKAANVEFFGATGKTTPVNTDQVVATTNIGTSRLYNELTGILTIEAGVSRSTSETAKQAGIDLSGNYVASVFAVINASANPALLSVPALSTSPVSASYWLSATFSTSPTIPINFDQREWDSHLAVTPHATQWRFTCPIGQAGTYLVTGAGNAAASLGLMCWKNGVSHKMAGAFTNPGSISFTIRLLAGEYFDIRGVATQNVTGGSMGSYPVCNIQIVRVGSYVV